MGNQMKSLGINSNIGLALIKAAASSLVICVLIASHATFAYDQPWNGNREDITSPAPPPPPPCPGGSCQCPNPANTSSPVYTADGSLVWSDTDIVFPVQTRVTLTRTYNSFDYRAGLFGRGWVTAQESNIAKTFRAVTEGNSDGSPKPATEFESVPIWLAAHGRRYILEETATNCNTPAVLYFTFEKLDDGSFKQVFEDSSSFSIYGSTGMLLEEYSDLDGATLYYEYDEQKRLVRQYDSYGFSLNFSYNDQGFVSRVSDQASRAWTYSYDQFGRLAQVLDPDGNTKNYQYQRIDNVGYSQHLLTSVADNLDDPVLSVVWNSVTIGSGQGPSMRVASYTESDGHRHDYTYSATTFNGQPAVRVVKDTKQIGSNSSIERRTFIADAANYQIFSEVNNTKNISVSNTYDSQGNLLEHTDKRGKKTKYQYNSFGRKTNITEFAGTTEAREIEITYWNSTDRISTINEYGIRETRFEYDSENRVAVQTQVDLADNRARIWSYTYHPNTVDSMGRSVLGKVASVDGPLPGPQDTTRFEYNEVGFLRRVDYPLNQSILYSYNSIGQKISETDINGNVTDFSYNSRNRLVRSSHNGRSVLYQYDPQGLLRRLVDEKGGETSFSYNDQNQPTRIEYPAGDYLQIDYSYYAAYTEVLESHFSVSGTLVSRNINRRDPLSGRAVSGYLDSISKQVYWDQYNSFGDTTQKTLYGQFGNATATTTANYQYQYDEDGKPAGIINAANGEVSFAYDSMDRLANVADPNLAVTHYSYNAWDDLISRNSADTGLTVYEYDPSGNRVAKVLANGVRTVYSYDAQSRLSGVDHEGSDLDITLIYDEGVNGKGKLTSVFDGSGSTTLHYDDREMIVRNTSTIAGVALATDYVYDESDQLVQMGYPSGLVVKYILDEFGRLEGVQSETQATSQNILSDVTWAGLNISGYTYGNGLQAMVSLDLSERTVGKTFGADYAFRNEYDNQGQVTRQEWTLGGERSSTEFTYDLNGHLVRDGGILPNSARTFTYDSIGNRLTEESTADAAVSAYKYLENSNRLIQVGGTVIRYDAVGNIIDDGNRQFEYNSMNRLEVLTNQSLNVQAKYSYNFRGQRARKELSGGVVDDIRYVYGVYDELLGEYDSSGNRIREYIYISHGEALELVAQIEADGSVLYIQTDHLSVPRLATDESQNVVWQWLSDGFGAALPQEDVDGDGINTVINHRFIGQYYDLESGLHYNLFRYYEPRWGRYITSDPLALDAGLNTYAYALQNPLRYSDPNGLAVPAVIAACAANPICAAAAAAAARAAAAAAIRAAARAAAAAAAAACAAGLGPCGSDPGDCSQSRHRYLQNIVDNLCKPNPGNCRPGEECSVMGDKLAKHTACADARNNINRECFRGGDRGHQIEYTNRRQQAAVCNGLLATCCP